MRLLQVEDSESDAALVVRLLGRTGETVKPTRVETEAEMRAALKAGPWDVVICDYQLPGFNAPRALALLQEADLDIPFLVVSGTIGERIAVEMMRAGAHDYLMKDNLVRLVPAVQREIREARVRAERRKAEQALRESETRYRLISENSADVIWTIELPSRRCTFISPSVERLLGYTPSEVLSLTIEELVTPEYRMLLAERLDETLRAYRAGDETARIQTTEFDCLHKNGAAVPAEAVTTLMVDEKGEALGMVGVTRDISRRKTAEDRLRESSRLNEQIISSTRDGVIVYGLDARYKLWNHAMEEMTGIRAEEVLGRHPLEAFPFLAGNGVYESILRALRGEIGEAREFPYRMERSNKVGWCSDTSAPLVDSNNRIIGAVGIVRDITAQRQAEEEQERLREQFLQAQKMECVGRLAGGVAHDFNNLLTVINGYSALLLGGLRAPDALRQPIKEILDAGQRATGLVQQLLAFSRKQVLKQEVVNLSELTKSMMRIIERLVSEDVEIVSHLADGLEPVFVDRQQIGQVIMNLVVNARDAMPSGGTLTIETGRGWREGFCEQCNVKIDPGVYLRLSIRDTGTGMDKHTLERLFEPFFTTKEAGRGTGLGLATVQGIVLQSNGHISVESVPGKGTSVHIYLPPAVRDEHEVPILPLAEATRGSETVLLVEDQEEVRRITAEMLESEGYRVLEAPSADVALQLLPTEPIDLLLTDVVMPRMNGVELAAMAREKRPDLRVLFMSGYPGEHLARASAEPPSESFIQKPFSPTELASKVRGVLDRRRSPARILVVDDDPAVRGFLRAVLEEAGYRVDDGRNGVEAIRAIERSEPDVVIADMVGPEMEGLSLLHALRLDNRKRRLIVMAGAFSGNYTDKSHPLGADVVLTKPVRPDLLLAKLHELISQAGPVSAEGQNAGSTDIPSGIGNAS